MRSHRFTNSELVGSVLGSVAFAATKYPVNPGMSGSFPWLSVEASKWEQYVFHKLRYRFVTRTSTATTGSVILSPDYNVRDLRPTTEEQATDTQDAVEDAVWKELVCVLDPRAMFPSGPRKLVRSANVAGDANLYDAANFYVCTVEEANADAIGKLWVDYDVELFVPQNSPNDGSAGSTITTYGGRASAQSFTTATPAPVQFDAQTYDPLGIGAASTGVFDPAAGTYKIDFEGIFKDTSAETFTVLVEMFKNGAALAPQARSQSIVSSPASGQTSVFLTCVASFDGGTDQFQVQVTLTGAAGTLTLIANSAQLFWQSA
jgi:hypothetical protein